MRKLKTIEQTKVTIIQDNVSKDMFTYNYN